MSLCLLFEGTDELCGTQWSARMRALTNGAQFGFVFSCGEISAPATRQPASLPLLHGQIPIGWVYFYNGNGSHQQMSLKKFMGTP
jgi:hypothetical protein